VIPELTRLIALSPPDLADVNAAVRSVCAQTVGLPPLPSEPAGPADPAVTDFAEQFSADVSVITAEQRGSFATALGPKAFDATALIFIADFVPRVKAGLGALGQDWPQEPVDWDHANSPADLLLNGFAPVVGRMRTLDPVTSEIIRLRGARQHNCRLCKSLREGAALDAGGTEAMYDDIDAYESSALPEKHKAALRYADALIWSPATVDGSEIWQHFSTDEAVELTLDVMRNACNKIAVALGADAPRIPEGTERYLLGEDGQPVYS
jgi:alkylhydroperoxidase family enzyme